MRGLKRRPPLQSLTRSPPIPFAPPNTYTCRSIARARIHERTHLRALLVFNSSLCQAGLCENHTYAHHTYSWKYQILAPKQTRSHTHPSRECKCMRALLQMCARDQDLMFKWSFSHAARSLHHHICSCIYATRSLVVFVRVWTT